MNIEVIQKVNKKTGFTTIDNGFAQDMRLSLAARGFMMLIMTLKNIKGLTLEDIARYIGEDMSLRSKMDKARILCQELAQYGYCVMSSGKDSKGRFKSDYDFYEVPNQPPPIAIRGRGKSDSRHLANRVNDDQPEETNTGNSVQENQYGKTSTEKPEQEAADGLYIDSSIKRNSKINLENKDKNPLSHTRAREDFEIENIAVAANEKSQTSTPPAPPPPDQSRLTLWKDSGFAPNSEGGKEKFIKEVKGYMWNYHYLHKDLTEDNFDFDAFYLKCDTVFSNERATEGLAKRHRSDDFAKKAVVMLMTVKDSKYQHKDFLKDSNKQTDNNGNNNREGDTRSRIFKSLGIKEI